MHEMIEKESKMAQKLYTTIHKVIQDFTEVLCLLVVV